MPLIGVLFSFALYYVGIPLIIIGNIVTIFFSIILSKLSKKQALISVQIFLVFAGIAYLIYLIDDNPLEMLACGIFLAFYIFYFLTTLVRKERISDEERRKKEEATASYLKHNLK